MITKTAAFFSKFAEDAPAQAASPGITWNGVYTSLKNGVHSIIGDNAYNTLRSMRDKVRNFITPVPLTLEQKAAKFRADWAQYKRDHWQEFANRDESGNNTIFRRDSFLHPDNRPQIIPQAKQLMTGAKNFITSTFYPMQQQQQPTA